MGRHRRPSSLTPSVRAPSAKGDVCSVCSGGSRSPRNPALFSAGRQRTGAMGMGTHGDYERRGPCRDPVATTAAEGIGRRSVRSLVQRLRARESSHGPHCCGPGVRGLEAGMGTRRLRFFERTPLGVRGGGTPCRAGGTVYRVYARVPFLDPRNGTGGGVWGPRRLL